MSGQVQNAGLVLSPCPGAYYHYSKHNYAVFTRKFNLGYALPSTHRLGRNKKRSKMNLRLLIAANLPIRKRHLAFPPRRGIFVRGM
jgi:hypothetical protein